MRSPLTLWGPRRSGHATGAAAESLDEGRCHAQTCIRDGGRWSTFAQCRHKPKASRPFSDGHDYPVCGVHRNTYDKEANRLEAYDTKAVKDKQVKARVAELPAFVEAVPYWCSGTGLSQTKVVVSLEQLEKLLLK